jgi:hypothetical protein
MSHPARLTVAPPSACYRRDAACCTEVPILDEKR